MPIIPLAIKNVHSSPMFCLGHGRQLLLKEQLNKFIGSTRTFVIDFYCSILLVRIISMWCIVALFHGRWLWRVISGASRSQDSVQFFFK